MMSATGPMVISFLVVVCTFANILVAECVPRVRSHLILAILCLFAHPKSSGIPNDANEEGDSSTL